MGIARRHPALPCRVSAPHSKHTADEAAVDTEGGTVDSRCERAAYVGDEVRNFLGVDETFDQRSGPIFAHEAPFRLFEGQAGEDVLDEFGYPWGSWSSPA